MHGCPFWLAYLYLAICYLAVLFSWPSMLDPLDPYSVTRLKGKIKKFCINSLTNRGQGYVTLY